MDPNAKASLNTSGIAIASWARSIVSLLGPVEKWWYQMTFHRIPHPLPPRAISCRFHIYIPPRYGNVSGKHLFLRETISPLVHVQEAIALGTNVDENTLAFCHMDVNVNRERWWKMNTWRIQHHSSDVRTLNYRRKLGSNLASYGRLEYNNTWHNNTWHKNTYITWQYLT